MGNRLGDEISLAVDLPFRRHCILIYPDMLSILLLLLAYTGTGTYKIFTYLHVN